MVAAAMAIGMEDYASEIYQSESEPFVVEEDSKKKPIIVGRPVEEGAPELPEVKEIVKAAPSAEKSVEETVIESRELPPPPRESIEEKPRIKKPPKTPKAKPPEKAEEKAQSRPPEKVEKSQARPAEKTSTSFSDEIWQIAAIAGLGIIILFFIRRPRV